MTTTANVSPDLRIARVTAIVSFQDVILQNGKQAGIDLGRLGMFAERGSSKTLVTQKPVDCALDGSWLRIHNQEHKFRAGKKGIILKLFEAWESGYAWVPVSDLLNNYDAVTRLEDVFKDNRADRKGKWRGYIQIHEQRARLIVPPV